MTTLSELIAKKESGENINIFDMRGRQDFAASHIQGTENLPFDEVASIVNRVSDRDDRIFLFCDTGRYSNSAVKVLKYLSYTNVCDLGAIGDLLAYE